jgi:hypothetical protein
MANTKISGLSPGASVTDADVFPNVQTVGVGPVKTSASQLKSYVLDSLTNVTLTTGTVSTTPSNATDLANKAYVDSFAAGITFKQAANYATTAALTATYVNGTLGVNATLTNSGTQAALVIDGRTFTATDVTNGVRILVKNQATAAQNGCYTLTNEGSGSVNWVLTRATDYDQSAELKAGDFFFVLSGTLNGNTSWTQQTAAPITMGSGSIMFSQFGAAGVTYSAGTGLTLTGTQFKITNTAVTPASYGTASSVPVLAVNAQGQITSAATNNIAINASAITAGTLPPSRGGTGISTVNKGIVLYGSAAGVLNGLAAGATGRVLTMANTGLPTWAPPSVVGASLTINTTPITGGVSGKVLYNNAGAVGETTLSALGGATTGKAIAMAIVFGG